MRSRNIKPQLFTNDLLATADPLYTVIFEGLWCYCDREGRCEDRPTKIHLAVNPGRAYERTVEALEWLTTHGFIVRYQAGKNRYIAVPMFGKHQNPHYKEPPSTIPEPPMIADQASGFDPDDSGDSHRQDGQSSDDSDPILRQKPEASTPMVGGKARLIPDSGFLIPDSPSQPFPAQDAGKGEESATRHARREDGKNPRANGASPRQLGTNPRARHNRSLEAWRSACNAIDQVKGTDRTWADVTQALADPKADRAIEAAGGYRNIADRSQFNQATLESRFRTAYEQLLEEPAGRDTESATR